MCTKVATKQQHFTLFSAKQVAFPTHTHTHTIVSIFKYFQIYQLTTNLPLVNGSLRHKNIYLDGDELLEII